MGYLIASLLLLALAPLIVGFVTRHKRLSRWSAGFLLVAIVYVIFTHIIVENVQTYGWIAVFAAVAGMLVFGVGDEVFFAQKQRNSRFFLITVQVFLAFHAMVDGAALVGPALDASGALLGGHQHGQELSLSIVLHRLLFEIFVWKYFLERFGRLVSTLVLINVGVATIVGYVASQALFAVIPSYFGLFEAFIGGALLHLVYDYFKERIKGVAPHLIAPTCKKSHGSQLP